MDGSLVKELFQQEMGAGPMTILLSHQLQHPEPQHLHVTGKDLLPLPRKGVGEFQGI
ncbi:hypothetical protein EYZ11_007129 [Aspergillus tanneri]|uniref:Uncharacterized protein n=1 Tax=Aspergillus tanneri TaxID=1220188 RepID=A0A4S3JDS2_9EURO|nr:hypothetical protein EYZ11_007129 [Aspergillus tanneri]